MINKYKILELSTTQKAHNLLGKPPTEFSGEPVDVKVLVSTDYKSKFTKYSIEICLQIDLMLDFHVSTFCIIYPIISD